MGKKIPMGKKLAIRMAHYGALAPFMAEFVGVEGGVPVDPAPVLDGAGAGGLAGTPGTAGAGVGAAGGEDSLPESVASGSAVAGVPSCPSLVPSSAAF